MKANLYIELLKSAINSYLYFGADSAISNAKFFNNSKWLIPNALKPHTLKPLHVSNFLKYPLIRILKTIFFTFIANNF